METRTERSPHSDRTDSLMQRSLNEQGQDMPSDEMDSDSNQEMVDSDENEDTDDSGDDADLCQQQIKQLEEKLAANPFDYDSRVEVIKLYQQSGELDVLRLHREKFSEIYPLTAKLWLEWITDESKLASSDDEKSNIIKLFERAIQDYVSVDIWLEYVQSSIGLMSGELYKLDDVRNVFERGLSCAGLNVCKGSLLWEAYIEFEQAVLNTCTTDEARNVQVQRIFDTFKRQLSIPLIGMENTLEEFRQWCKSIEETTTKPMSPDSVNFSYEKALKELQKVTKYEDNIASEGSHLPEYLTYIEYEEKHGTQPRVQCLYERALLDNCLNHDLWLRYTNYLNKKVKLESVVLPVYHRATRNCPWSSDIWINYLRTLERYNQSQQKVIEVFEAALKSGFHQSIDYRNLWISYLDYLRRKTDWKSEKDVDNLRKNFEQAVEHLNSINDDEAYYILNQYLAKIEAKYCNNIQRAREIWNDLLTTHRELMLRFQVWLDYITLEKEFGDDKHLKKFLIKRLQSYYDAAEVIGEILMKLEREEGRSIEDFDDVLQKYNEAMRKVNDKRKKEEKADEENVSKRRKQGGAEHKAINKHNNVNDKKSQNERKSNKRKVENSDDVPATTSADTSQLPVIPKYDKEGFKVPATPAKDEATPVKVKKSNELENVERGTQNRDVINPDKELETIFVSNLDFKVDVDELKEIFSQFGEIEDLRLVKNYKGLSKGFGFVQFTNVSGAKEALKNDRIQIRERPVFISEMNKKKNFQFKKGLEEHKLFVKNLSTQTTQAELRTIFEKYGDIKDIRLVTYRNGHSKGCAYVEFKDQIGSRNALKADGLLVNSKNIRVAISDPSKSSDSKFMGSGSMTTATRTHAKQRISAPMVPTIIRRRNQTMDHTNGSKESQPSTSMSNSDFRSLLLGSK